MVGYIFFTSIYNVHKSIKKLLITNLVEIHKIPGTEVILKFEECNFIHSQRNVPLKKWIDQSKVLSSFNALHHYIFSASTAYQALKQPFRWCLFLFSLADGSIFCKPKWLAKRESREKSFKKIYKPRIKYTNRWFFPSLIKCWSSCHKMVLLFLRRAKMKNYFVVFASIWVRILHSLIHLEKR